jgi:hypothetical protein
MRHLAGSSASCRRAVGLTLSRYDVLGSLRFGFRPDGRQPLPWDYFRVAVNHPESVANRHLSRKFPQREFSGVG